MGTTGPGSLDDYKPEESDKCDSRIEADLEEIANTDYYRNSKGVPAPGTVVRLSDRTLGGRLVVQETATGTNIGLLPTKYNYLRICQGKGYHYEGQVLSSRSLKIPRVRVDLEPV
jgi:hypothetical protein